MKIYVFPNSVISIRYQYHMFCFYTEGGTMVGRQLVVVVVSLSGDTANSVCTNTSQ